MNTNVEHNGISFELLMHEEPFYIKNLDSYGHPATLHTSGPRDEVSKKIIGVELWGEKVLAVESFARLHLNNGDTISLLIKKKMWGNK